MNKVLLALLSCVLSVISFTGVAAEPRREPTEQERARTVYIFHQPIVMLQAKFGLTTPEERVLRIRHTLRNFTQQDVREPLKIVPITRYNQQGRLIVMNNKPVLLLTQADWMRGRFDSRPPLSACWRGWRRNVRRFAINMTPAGWRSRRENGRRAAGSVSFLVRGVAVVALGSQCLPSPHS